MRGRNDGNRSTPQGMNPGKFDGLGSKDSSPGVLSGHDRAFWGIMQLHMDIVAP